MTDLPTAAMSAGGPQRVIADRYRMESLLGRGGTAEVWRCTDEALERQVALKLVTGSGGEDANRVGDEARLLARLSHPGLVPVYDAGTDEIGAPYVVMELVDGETLADPIRRGPIPPDQVASIGGRLADALAYVHEQGLVHRDVKPANVLLGKDGRVRLTDFGIARLVDAAKVTATGLTVGTASYLSPEQVTAEPVGPPADVYALGLVLLECLTGKREYPGSAVEVALARLSRQPEVPSTLPTGWPALLSAMTDRDPARRPTSNQVADDLHAIATGGEVTTVFTPPPAAERTQAIDRTRAMTTVRPAQPVRSEPRPAAAVPRQRNNWPVAIGLLTAVAVLALVGLFLGTRSNETAVPDPVQVDTSVPAKIRRDLTTLQQQVRK
ncbi:MAG: serine/threonine protein kinase [Actinobacteria bacterium]|nr:serine/threonine protein kinase [Actinomycetota bacterium]MCA1720878.1 serine/threonine protein kinase [Actinomycetota bacterium]